MKKKILFSQLALLSLIVVFSSCSTLSQQDKIYSTEKVVDNIEIAKNIEKAIITQYKEQDSKKIAQIKLDLDNLLATESSDFEFLAIANSLYSDYYLLRRSKYNAKKMLEKAKQYNPHNELVHLVDSRLIKSNDDKIKFLTSLIKKNPDFYRLKAELGYAYYAQQDYRNALASFDAALEFLPEEYTNLYGEKREYCKKFYKVDSDIKSASSEILQKNKILLYEMTALAQDNTNALDFITGTAKWKPLMLAEKLKANGWYAEETDVKNNSATRKDAALFLWHLIAGNNSEKLSKYSRRYASRGGKSPISDVQIDGVFFDSILGNIEEDIIPLIDGTEFKPNNPVSGLEFYNWLKKADEIKN